MRILASLAALGFLAACATAPAATTAPAAAVTPAPAGSSRAAQMLALAGRDNAPTPQDVERLFGAPDIRRQDGAGMALTYRTQTCGLLLVFAADSRNAMRLAEAHPSARRAGETAPSLETCAAEASARR